MWVRFVLLIAVLLKEEDEVSGRYDFEEIEKLNYENQKERDKLKLEIKELEKFVVTAKQCGLIEVSINSEK